MGQADVKKELENYQRIILLRPLDDTEQAIYEQLLHEDAASTTMLWAECLPADVITSLDEIRRFGR